MWQKLNDLNQERPMVWINEIPWHEMNVNDELTVQTQHPWARELETNLRRTVYQWKHMPCDMIVNDYLDCPVVYNTTDLELLRMWIQFTRIKIMRFIHVTLRYK